MKNIVLKFFLQILLLIITLFVGFWIGKQLGIYFSPQKTEEHFQIIESIKPIAKIATFKLHQLEELDWSNETQNKVTNFLYAKKLQISVPIIATYGYDLDSTNFLYHIQNDTLKLSVTKPKLLSFEVLWNEKKVFSEKGLLQFENDHQFDALERLVFEQKLKKYENLFSALKKTKEVFENQMVKFYKNLGLQVKILEN